MDVTWQEEFVEELIADLWAIGILAALFLLFSVVCIIAIWWTHKY